MVTFLISHQKFEIGTYDKNMAYFKENCKLIAIDLSEQKALDADPRPIQLINFTGNLKRTGNTTRFFTIKEVNETILEISQRLVKVLQTCFINFVWYFILISI